MPIRRPRRVAAAAETWFAAHQRDLPWRRSYTPYHVWVSEVMAQQTRMEVVVRYFQNFVSRFPDVGALAAATEDQVLAAWSGLGYYRRARMLRDGARDVVARFAGVVPQSVEELQSIAGIGRYTAGAIASIAFGGRAAVVDGNVARVVARLAGIDAATGSPALMKGAWQEAERLVAACASPRALNQALMELGALLCTPRAPRCEACPLRRECAACASGRQASIPAARVERATRALDIALYVVSDSRGRILMRREQGALMRAMFHLPHGDTSLLPGLPLGVERERFIGAFRHTVTTRRITFQLYEGRLASGIHDGDEYAWIDPGKLAEVPHPSYVAKALQLRKRGLQSVPCAGG